MKNSLEYEERKGIGTRSPEELMARLEDLKQRYQKLVTVNASLHENLFDLAGGLDKRIAHIEKLITLIKK